MYNQERYEEEIDNLDPYAMAQRGDGEELGMDAGDAGFLIGFMEEGEV